METTRSSQGTDKIRTTGWVRRLAIGGALAASLVVAGAGAGAGAQESDSGSFFDRNPGFAVSRNSVDPFDPFAPVASGGPAAMSAHKSVSPAAEASMGWSEANLLPMPGLPGESS
jgi:hypothetical protein